MRLPQRFKRVPHQEPGEDQDIILSAIPLQTKVDVKGDIATDSKGGFERLHADTEYVGGAIYTVTHRKTWVERLENIERRRFGTRLVSLVYDNFVAGWRAGLLRAFLFSLAALVANISIFLWLFFKFKVMKGSGLIRTSTCKEVDVIETAIKVGLNVVSTLILGASTYAMQGTTSPTRKEVDKAHEKGRWLEIGTQSWRNLVYVSRRHALIWGVLAFTSLPLHLVFNAVFFTTTETYQYAVAVVSQDFLDNKAFQITPENSSPALRFSTEQLQWPQDEAHCNGGDCSWDVKNDTIVVNFLENVRDPDKRVELRDRQALDDARAKQTHLYTKLSAEQCFQSFIDGFMQSYSDVLVVSQEVQTDDLILWTRYPQRSMSGDKMDTNPDPFHWVCHDELEASNYSGTGRCSRSSALKSVQSKNWTAESWTVYGHPVDHCFARIAPELCHLQYNAYTMLAVAVFSAIKVAAIAVLVFTHPDGEFLRTIGDAIASFLKVQDPVTKDMCLVSSNQIRKYGFPTSDVPQKVTRTRRRWLLGIKEEVVITFPYTSQVYTNSRPRWWTGANTTEFFSTVGISGVYVIVLSCSLYWAISEANGLAFDSGFGGANIQSLANLRPDSPKSSVIVPTILTANVPQLGFSLLYVFYTNIWSKLLIAQEFDRLTASKKGLRVSERPYGQQRTSRFFTLPFKYALPLMAFSAALHYLCSQSLFMARFDGMRDGQLDEKDQMVRLGYNAAGMIALIGVNVVMMVITICMAGFRRLSTGLGEMSMSVVISAACHLKRYEAEPWLQAVQWGDVSEGVGEIKDGQIVRHCGFTSLLAERPTEGHAYQ